MYAEYLKQRLAYYDAILQEWRSDPQPEELQQDIADLTKHRSMIAEQCETAESKRRYYCGKRRKKTP